MSKDKKVEKKRLKIQNQINSLEALLADSLKKKDSSTAEISVSDVTRKITQLKKELETL